MKTLKERWKIALKNPVYILLWVLIIGIFLFLIVACYNSDDKNFFQLKYNVGQKLSRNEIEYLETELWLYKMYPNKCREFGTYGMTTNIYKVDSNNVLIGFFRK